jgi:transposase
MSRFSRVRARDIIAAMLEGPHVIAPNATADGLADASVAAPAAPSPADIERLQDELKFAKTQIAALNFEIARLKRWRFGQSSESLDTQAALFDAIVADTRAEDTAAQDEQSGAGSKRAPRRAVRQALPSGLPRIEHHHELPETVCECGQPLQRIGEDVSEQLDCVPAQFFVHRHIRGKYACRCCQTIAAAALPAQIIDKGIPAPGLLAQVVVAKHDDHLPLYRQSEIYARSGVHIARSTMAQWVGICGVRLAPLADALREFILGHRVIHADETPVALLAPGKGKTHRAYMWVYRTTDYIEQRAVWFDFCKGRGGEHPRRVLEDYAGTMVTDDYGGYKALYASGAIIEAGCMAHARRKLFEAHELNGSKIAGHAVTLIARLYVIEREIKDFDAPSRHLARQQRSKAAADELHEWLTGQRQRLANADATAKAIDYSLGRWKALMRFLDDGEVPIDNNAVENSIRPLALGRRNWLFVGSQLAGERAANIISLIESAKLNGHDPWAYLKDVFERLPTLKNSDLASILPHNWQPPERAAVPAAVRPAIAAA